MMPDHYLRYVPLDPLFRPSEAAASDAQLLLLQLLPQAEAVAVKFNEPSGPLDGGFDWNGVLCPSCGAEAMLWWADAMSEAAAGGFDSLQVRAQCCGASIALNAPRYGWPAAFGRFVVEAVNPQVEALAGAQIARLCATLGCGVQEVAEGACAS